MILSIHQPSYFPWLGLLHKIAKSNVYMVMDEVQLSDSAYQNRNLFLTPDGKSKFLTIGIDKKSYMLRKFYELEILQDDWQEKHKNMLIAYYSKHPFFNEVFDFIQPIFQKRYSLLWNAVVDSMLVSMKLLDISTEVIYQHNLQYDRASKKSELVLSLVKCSLADIYLAGTGSRGYMELASFEAEGIQVEFDSFNHPVYNQKYQKDFHPGLSCLDLLFNHGIKKSREIFWQNIKAKN